MRFSMNSTHHCPPAVFCFFSFSKASHLATPLPSWVPQAPVQPVQVDEHTSRKVHTAALTICGGAQSLQPVVHICLKEQKRPAKRQSL